MNRERVQRLGRPLPLLAFALVLLAFSWASYVALRVEAAGGRDDARLADAVVVLGADQDRGWPSAVFHERLDHALGLYEEGVAPLLVVVGGNPDEDSYTEADAGVRYLQDRGIPPEALLGVGRGDSTYASLRELKAVAEQEELGPMVLVSDRFHMFRSLAMAEDLGLEAYGSPTTTSPIEDSPVARLYYTLREVAAYTAYVLSSSAGVAKDRAAFREAVRGYEKAALGAVGADEGKLDLTKVLWSSLDPDLEAIRRERRDGHA